MSEQIDSFQALRELSSRGITITPPALYLIAIKYGIGKKHGVHYSFDKSKLIEWAEKKRERAPGGVLPLRDASEKYNIPISTIYKAVKMGKLSVIKIGHGQGVSYVNKSDIKKYKESHNGKRKNDSK